MSIKCMVAIYSAHSVQLTPPRNPMPEEQGPVQSCTRKPTALVALVVWVGNTWVYDDDDNHLQKILFVIGKKIAIFTNRRLRWPAYCYSLTAFVNKSPFALDTWIGTCAVSMSWCLPRLEYLVSCRTLTFEMASVACTWLRRILDLNNVGSRLGCFVLVRFDDRSNHDSFTTLNKSELRNTWIHWCWRSLFPWPISTWECHFRTSIAEASPLQVLSSITWQPIPTEQCDMKRFSTNLCHKQIE